MEEKTDPQEEVEGPKMQMPLPLDSLGPPPGGTGTALLREEVMPPITMECLRKAAEQVADGEESSSDEAVVTVARILPLLGPVVAVVAEWVAEAVETTVQPLPEATIMSPRPRGAVAGMARIGPSITQLGPETAVKHAVRVQSMKKSPRGGGREGQRLAVRAVQVTSVTRTKTTTRNPTARTAPIIPTLLAATQCHLHHPEAPRPGSSPPGVCPLEGAGVEVVEEETSTEVVAMLEDHLEDTGLDPAQPLMVGPQRRPPRAESSRARHNPLRPKTWEGEGTEERRKTR